MDSLELKVNRKNTEAFISERPETITITRGGSRTSDGAGGWTTTPGAPIQPQTFRLIIQGGNVASRNIDGEEIKPAYVMVGRHDADLKTGDMFVKDGRNYDVVYVRDNRDYEVWAEVVYRG